MSLLSFGGDQWPLTELCFDGLQTGNERQFWISGPQQEGKASGRDSRTGELLALKGLGLRLVIWGKWTSSLGYEMSKSSYI